MVLERTGLIFAAAKGRRGTEVILFHLTALPEVEEGILLLLPVKQKWWTEHQNSTASE